MSDIGIMFDIIPFVLPLIMSDIGIISDIIPAFKRKNGYSTFIVGIAVYFYLFMRYYLYFLPFFDNQGGNTTLFARFRGISIRNTAQIRR